MSEEKDGKRNLSNDSLPRPSRRNLLVGSGALVTGGVAGHLSGAQSASAQETAPPAPELPWEWAKIDPQEAGERTYRAYLTDENG